MLRIASLLWLTTFTILLSLLSVICLAQPSFNTWMARDCSAVLTLLLFSSSSPPRTPLDRSCPASARSSLPPSLAPVLGQPPRPYYRKLFESIVGDLRFPNTLTISCITLHDGHYSQLSRQNTRCFPGNDTHMLTERA